MSQYSRDEGDKLGYESETETGTSERGRSINQSVSQYSGDEGDKSGYDSEAETGTSERGRSINIVEMKVTH